jgi:hypothetical protein
MNMSDKDNSDKNNKPKTPKQSRKDKKPDPQDRVDNLVQAALASHLVEYAEKKKHNKETLNDVSNLIQEHLNSFIILGYNYDGDPISHISAQTQQEADSLCTLINKFLMQNTPPGGI